MTQSLRQASSRYLRFGGGRLPERTKPPTVMYGVGIDLAYIPRFQRILTKYGNRFLKRAFHPAEIEQFQKLATAPSPAPTSSVPTINARQCQFIASRWAVKEATVKAAGCRLLFPEILLYSGSQRRRREALGNQTAQQTPTSAQGTILQSQSYSPPSSPPPFQSQCDNIEEYEYTNRDTLHTEKYTSGNANIHVGTNSNESSVDACYTGGNVFDDPRPSLHISGHSASLLQERGAGRIMVSLSHDRDYATAIVYIDEKKAS